MTLQQFISLGKVKKQQVVLSNGFFVAERKDGPFKVMLYQLDDFYVEVYLFSLYNKVALFKAFDNLSCLDPYLTTINLSPLLNEVFS